MKSITIFSIILIVMIGIAYVSGGEIAQHYGEQSIYGGHEIYVASPNSGDIDGNPAKIIHIGYVNLKTFKIYAVYENKDAIVLDHSIFGVAGSSIPVSFKSKQTLFSFGKNISYSGINLIYENMIGNMIVYNVNGINIGVSTDFKTIISIGQDTYTITQVNFNGNTYIQIMKNLINKVSVNSIVFLLTMAIIIYSIGEIALGGEERWD